MINYLEPSIVIVDDVEEEYLGISNYYTKQGIGCKVFNPDLYDGDEYPEKPYSDLNLIFLDLFYSGKFDTERCVSWVRHLIKPKSFYILIMWTNDTSKGEEVSALLDEHNVNPFKTIIEAKSKYRNNKGFDFTTLFGEIENQLNETPALEEILIWKKTVKYSSNEIIGHLTRNPEFITAKIQKIVICHGGTSILKSKDDNHKRNILFDALDTVLISNTRKNIPEKISELNATSVYGFDEQISTEPDKELNSWFHFKIENEIHQDLILPGLIAKNNHRFLKKLYSIQDDYKIENLLVKQRESDTIIDDIVMVISRPCDIAQKKYGKNIKLLSGLIVYKPVRNKKGFALSGSSIDSLKIYDYLYFDPKNKDVAILFDYRYAFSIPESLFVNKFENMKIFNKELLSEIQVEYSSYSSRLGITQII